MNRSIALWIVGAVFLVAAGAVFTGVPAVSAQELTAEDAFYRQPPPPAAGAGEMDQPRRLALYLGLKYAILEHRKSGAVTVVDENHVFRNGDVIRLRLWVNDDGYLYVVNRDAAGIWSLVFPSPVFRGGNNRLTKSDEPYVIPVPPGGFEFYGEPGKEELYVVFSRKEINFLEQRIYEKDTNRPEKKHIRKDVLLASNRLDIEGTPPDLVPKGIRPIATVDEHFQDVSLKQEMSGPVQYAVLDSPDKDRIVQKITLIHR